MQSIHNCTIYIPCSVKAVCDISKIRNVVNSQQRIEYANTNCAVCDISKIRNVVNSQLIPIHSRWKQCCLRYIKDTKCSQFTTNGIELLAIYKLFAIYQRYEMQSIHNHCSHLLEICHAVCDISKIQQQVLDRVGFESTIWHVGHLY